METNQYQADIQTKREILYKFWTKLPYIKVLNPEIYDDRKNPVRRAIIKILRKGIPEKDEIGNKIRRHALSAREILSILKKKNIVNKKYDISSLYFHIKRGLDVEVLQKVAIIPEGNHNITYYGRTAQIFLTSPTADSNYAEKFRKEAFELADLFSRIDTTFNQKKFIELMDTFLIYIENRDNRINEVLKRNEEFIQSAEVSIKDVYNFLKFVDIHPQKIKILNGLFDLLPTKLDITQG